MVAIIVVVAVAVLVTVAAVYFNSLKNHCHRFMLCDHYTVECSAHIGIITFVSLETIFYI